MAAPDRLTGCPSAGALQEFLDGTAARESGAAIRAHLEACSECRAVVLALAPAPIAGAAEPDASTDGGIVAGQRVGRFIVLGRIGEGGMGVVYAAQDPELHRNVALKLMRRAKSGDDASIRAQHQRLQREAHAMARLSHPSVITIYQVGTYEEGVFIAMELVDGETLSRWNSTPRDWREVLDVFLRAGRGLEAAHLAGLVHRDFKPDNVLVGKDGRVRVTDFGLARMAGGAVDEAKVEARAEPFESPLRLSLTNTGTLLGTPGYMAPEQLDGEPSDVRSDVFSFCVALYEALYRERPFAGTTLRELRSQIALQTVRTPQGKHEVPARIRRVLMTGLRVQPGERPATMGALLSALEQAARTQRLRPSWVVAALILAAAAAVAWASSTRHRASSPAPTSTQTAPAPTSTQTAPAPTSTQTAPAPTSTQTTNLPPIVEPPRPTSPGEDRPPDSRPHAAAGLARKPALRGVLQVRVDVDARIELDERVVGDARAARVRIEAGGAHRLRVSAPGYQTFQTQVRVEAGEVAELPISLTRDESPAKPPVEDPNAAVDPYAK